MSAVVICPKCRGRTIINRSKQIAYTSMFFVFGLIFFAIGIFFTVLSYDMAEHDGGGVYYVYWGFSVCGLLWLVRGILYVYYNRNAKPPTFRGV
jgi:uncharacterized membrane protein HdeD (DUF308 family)